MRLSSRLLVSAMTAAALLSSCGPKAASEASKAELVVSESKALNAWFAARFEDELARSPMSQTYLGQKDNQDRLDDSSQLADDEGAALAQQWLKDMRARFDIDRLDGQSKLSYRLYEFAAEDDLATGRLINPMGKVQPASGEWGIASPSHLADDPRVVAFRTWLLSQRD